jgi:pimeloyl-ACP methyl ester carboxylesterase
MTKERKMQVRAAAFAAVLTVTATAGYSWAQDLSDVKKPAEPLMLQSRGSFIIGGESVQQTPIQLSTIFGPSPAEGGHITLNQMYVEFMVPAEVSGVPVVMLHGATLSGKTYDTTPDGRMGWYEYFVRRGHPTYVPDQVSRARSGFDISVYNDVRAGVRPPADLPNAFRQADELNWTQFRIGPAYGQAFPDGQFPIEFAAEMSRQAIPDLNATLPTPNPNFRAMADLAVQLRGAVLMGHSETGALPLNAAVTDPAGVKGLILVEPGGCNFTPWTEENIAMLASVPILVVFGDHLDLETGLADFSWQNAYNDCQSFIARVNAANGNAQMLYPPDRGIRGNSHVLMMDRNNLQIADLILDWMRTEVERP